MYPNSTSVKIRAKIGAGAVALLAGAAALLGSAQTRTLERLSLEELVQESDAVVLATARGATTAMANGGVVTRTEFLVSDAAFGDANGVIAVETPGGAIPGAKISVAEVESGVPLFISGTQSLLFLDRANGGYALVDPLQGAVLVDRDAAGGATVRLQSAGASMKAADALEMIGKMKAKGPGRRLGE